MDNELRYTLNEIGRRNLDAPHQWEFLAVDQLQFTRPTVICLSGSGTTENKSANKVAKIVQNYLDLMCKTADGKTALDDIDIIGVKYARQQPDDLTGFITAPFVDQLANAIVNLLTDDNQHRLPLPQAQKNFARLTFFTYCYGKQVLENLLDRLNTKLATLGYTPAEIAAINCAGHEVAFAPLTPQANQLPSVHLISNNDVVTNVALKHLYTEPQLAALNGITIHQDNPGMLYGQKCANATAPSIQIVSSSLLNTRSTFHLVYNDHNLDCISRDDDWRLKSYQLCFETHYSPNADCASQMLAWALCRAVENSRQNFQSQQYVPNTYLNTIVPELQSIIDSYPPQKLAKPTAKFNGMKSSITREL